ncbi:MAG TPA: class I SAM-dependent methyltransferase, partial [Rhodanobacteraceae bacterium]|nr:class I SAM-dependent methyltransferase [Rhodanobacteraceae bacterium]
MSRTRAHARIEALLNFAGVRIDGDAPSDIRVHDRQLYSRILAHGSLGLGEAYMDGWWDADDLDGFLFRLLDTRLDERVGGFEDAWLYAKSRFLNLQRGRRAYVIGEHHYDLGNDLFEAMLGKRLVYSCGYWQDATDLDTAQEAKLHLIFRKL